MADALSDERARQGEANEPSGAGNGEHVLKFRNYRPRSDKIEYQKARAGLAGLAAPRLASRRRTRRDMAESTSVDRGSNGPSRRSRVGSKAAPPTPLAAGGPGAPRQGRGAEAGGQD